MNANPQTGCPPPVAPRVLDKAGGNARRNFEQTLAQNARLNMPVAPERTALTEPPPDSHDCVYPHDHLLQKRQWASVQAYNLTSVSTGLL